MSIFKKYFLAFILIFISYNYSYSQPDREQVGNENLLNISGGAFYNYAQKNKVNIEVNIFIFDPSLESHGMLNVSCGNHALECFKFFSSSDQ